VIEQQGRVVECLPSRARIEVGPAQGCSRCASGKGCGAGLFVRLLNRKPTQLVVDSSEPLTAGQSVTVGIPESLFLRWVAQLYGLPLVAAFAIAIPVQLLAEKFSLGSGPTDFAVLAGAVSGFVIMLLVLQRRFITAVTDTCVQLVDSHSSSISTSCTASN